MRRNKSHWKWVCGYLWMGETAWSQYFGTNFGNLTAEGWLKKCSQKHPKSIDLESIKSANLERF